MKAEPSELVYSESLRTTLTSSAPGTSFAPKPFDTDRMNDTASMKRASLLGSGSGRSC